MMQEEIPSLYENFGANSVVSPSYYSYYDIKRGLRNADGTGVAVGISGISNVHGYIIDEGDKLPEKGKLTLRGYNLADIVRHTEEEHRFGFEEVTYLLMSGNLPTIHELDVFNSLINAQRDLPVDFVRGLILKDPSRDIMNMLARSVLLLYATDEEADSLDPHHEIDTAISLISRLPRIAALAYHSREAYYNNGPMFWNPAKEGLSTAEMFLYMLRPDGNFTPEEAHMLDIMLMLHAEHGGGNNSTFTCRVLTSTGTDPYSAYAGAIGSLKGPRHGGANLKAMAMHEDLGAHITDWEDEGQIADYLRKILKKEAFDRTGLIYGMGHAVYTLSDPRAELLKEYAHKLTEGTSVADELALVERIEKIAPDVIGEAKGHRKQICANVDMYSGLVYRAMGIPLDLITPLFACARMAGWAAHRFEEITSGKRIIRPAYKSVTKPRSYVPLAERAVTQELEPQTIKPTLSTDEVFGD